MVDRTGELLMIDWELAHIGDPREDPGAMASDDELHRAGREVLKLRLAHELKIMGEWTMVGRS